jgi:hypothetical protein
VKEHNLISLRHRAEKTKNTKRRKGEANKECEKAKHENPQEITETKSIKRLLLLLMTAHRYLFVIGRRCLTSARFSTPLMSVGQLFSTARERGGKFHSWHRDARSSIRTFQVRASYWAADFDCSHPKYFD